MEPTDGSRKLSELREALLRLHKTLLESERSVYERDIARINSSGQLLELVLHDPWFAWLHELSELIVVIDETLESEAAIAADTRRLIGQSRALLVPAEEGGGFGRRYFEALQRDPDVVLAHGRTMKVLASLQ